MTDWRDGYRKAVADFLKRKGMFVDLRHYEDTFGDMQDDYETWNVTYGWADHYHGRKPGTWEFECEIDYVDFESMREQSLSLFENTFTSNRNVAGVEVRATCKCGKYTNRWLRWEGALGDILPELLKGEA